ncbi:protein MANBAL isoform X2 [Mauremys reevesii]|nr:protein MANBAL isoform X2 [Mauremys reevesii]
MAAELDFSPPEVPEPTFLENVLRYGLFFGAIFQLICVLAIILPISKSHKTKCYLSSPLKEEIGMSLSYPS